VRFPSVDSDTALQSEWRRANRGRNCCDLQVADLHERRDHDCEGSNQSMRPEGSVGEMGKDWRLTA
jgi:hypothetical protein